MILIEDPSDHDNRGCSFYTEARSLFEEELRRNR
jgi:hypothetical protein